MADTYKLQYDGMTLTYPGWNGFLEYKKRPGRYEYCLFDAGGYNCVNSGTLTEPLSSFDSVMFKLTWAGNAEFHGINYYTEKISNKYTVPYRFATNDKFYCNVIMIDCPSSGTTFNTISAAGSRLNYTGSTSWDRQTDYSTMPGYTLYPIINAIYGVKYEL